MPSSAWLTITGEEEIAEEASGEDSIGGMSVAAHESEIQVLGIDQIIYLPTDPRSGQPTGSAISRGLIVTKLFDKTSPLLLEAMTKGQVFDTAELKYFRTAPDGSQEHYFTQTIQKVVISDIQSYMPNCLDPINKNFTHMEKVTLQYSNSTWTHEIAGTEGNFHVGIFASE
jgi:type VI secretion system secreted protein Hcp